METLLRIFLKTTSNDSSVSLKLFDQIRWNENNAHSHSDIKM